MTYLNDWYHKNTPRVTGDARAKFPYFIVKLYSVSGCQSPVAYGGPLNLSGGVGADLLGRYGLRMQAELHRLIAGRTPRAAQQGEVFAYAGPELPYKAVLHAVAVDGWYHATPDFVQATMATALRMAMELTAKKVTLAALATGFGDLTLPDFAIALRPLLSMDFPPIEEVCLCLMEDYRLAQLVDSLSSGD